jgi:hypothetical protein
MIAWILSVRWAQNLINKSDIMQDSDFIGIPAKSTSISIKSKQGFLARSYSTLTKPISKPSLGRTTSKMHKKLLSASSALRLNDSPASQDLETSLDDSNVSLNGISSSVGPKLKQYNDGSSDLLNSIIPAEKIVNDTPKISDPLALALFHIVMHFLQNVSIVDGNKDLYIVDDITERKEFRKIVASVLEYSHGSLSSKLCEFSTPAFQILSFISCSNFDIIYTYVFEGVFTTSNGKSNSIKHHEELSKDDISRLRVFELCNINQSRLLKITKELTIPIKTMQNKKVVPILIATVRNCYWNWIQNNPTEVSNLWRDKINLPDNGLFDYLFSQVDSKSKKLECWTLMTAILLTSGYDMSVIQNSQSEKKNSFLALLRKASVSDSPDIALICSIDFIKAASILSPEDCSIIRGHATSLEGNLVEKVLVEKVFEVKLKAADSEAQIIDMNAMIELVVYLAKFNKQVTKRMIVPILLDNSSPLHFKGIFTGACHHAVSKLWLNRVNRETLDITPYLRGCFLLLYSHSQEQKDLETSLSKVAALENKKKQKRTNKQNGYDYICDILNTWINYPHCFYFDQNILVDIATLQPIIKILTSFMNSSFELVRYLSYKTLLQLFSTQLYCSSMNDQALGETICKLIENALISLASLLITLNTPDSSTDSAVIKPILHCCYSLIEFWNAYVCSLNEHYVADPIFFLISTPNSLEVAFLRLLASSDVEIRGISAFCLCLLSKDVTNLPATLEIESHSSVFDSFSINSIAYLKFRHLILGGSDIYVMANERFHSIVRESFKLSVILTRGIATVCNELFRYWSFWLVNIFKCGLMDNSDINLETYDPKANNVLVQLPSSFDIIEWENVIRMIGCLYYIGSLSEVSNLSKEHNEHFSKFVKEMISLLSSNHCRIREAAAECICRHMTSNSIQIILKNLEHHTIKFFKSDGEPVINEANISLLESSLIILLSILRDVGNGHSLLPVSHITGKGFNLERFLTTYVEYVRLIRGSSDIIIRVKSNICEILAVIFSKTKSLLSNEQDFRNQMMNIIMEWNSDFRNVLLF